MRLRIFGTRVAVARRLAREIANHLATHRDIVLGLPTGRTSIPLYRELVALHRRGGADFSRATTFNLDEFLGVPSDHPGSYRRFMQRHLFDFVTPRRTCFLDGAASDARRECERYERAIARAGGIDLQILGLGANGHIGFNEPAPSLVARTHEARLSAATRRANAGLFGGRVRAVPRAALSMGMATILHARRIVLMATGQAKERAVRAMVEGRITTGVPASLLQVHPDAEVWLDRAAASALSRPSATASAGPRRPRRSRRARSPASGADGRSPAGR